ncbi:MAG: hypothetical protein HYU69_06750 [Bacteroidetes bacterium]|nr:hypothetical protein [Bacteroidota bacterium]
MISKTNIRLFYSISALFIILNVILMANNIYFLNTLPLVLIFLLAGIFSMDKLMLMIVFCTPLSLTLSDLFNRRLSPDFSFPTEPLLFGMLLLFVFKMIQGYRVDIKVMKHPITIAIIINLGWITLTTLTSTMPVISIWHAYGLSSHAILLQ